jgi:hypothetical protein
VWKRASGLWNGEGTCWKLCRRWRGRSQRTTGNPAEKGAGDGGEKRLWGNCGLRDRLGRKARVQRVVVADLDAHYSAAGAVSISLIVEGIVLLDTEQWEMRSGQKRRWRRSLKSLRRFLVSAEDPTISGRKAGCSSEF